MKMDKVRFMEARVMGNLAFPSLVSNFTLKEK